MLLLVEFEYNIRECFFLPKYGSNTVSLYYFYKI